MRTHRAFHCRACLCCVYVAALAPRLTVRARLTNGAFAFATTCPKGKRTTGASGQRHRAGRKSLEDASAARKRHPYWTVPRNSRGSDRRLEKCAESKVSFRHGKSCTAAAQDPSHFQCKEVSYFQYATVSEAPISWHIVKTQTVQYSQRKDEQSSTS